MVLTLAACASAQTYQSALCDLQDPAKCIYQHLPSNLAGGDITISDYTPAAQGFGIFGKSVYSLYSPSTTPGVYHWYDPTAKVAHISSWASSGTPAPVIFDSGCVGSVCGYVESNGSFFSAVTGGSWSGFNTNTDGAFFRGLALAANVGNTAGGYMNMAPITYPYTANQVCVDAFGNFVGQPVSLPNVTFGTQTILEWNSSSPFQGYESPAVSTVNTNGTAVTWVSGATFSSSWGSTNVYINGLMSEVSTVNSSTSLTTTVNFGVQTGVLMGAGWLSGVYPIQQTPCAPRLLGPPGLPWGTNNNTYYIAQGFNVGNDPIPAYNAFWGMTTNNQPAAGASFGAMQVASIYPAGVTTHKLGVLTSPTALGGYIYLYPSGPICIGTITTCDNPSVTNQIEPGMIYFDTTALVPEYYNGTSFIPMGGSQWSNGSAGAIYYNGGSVGIGTASPSAPLHISGTAKTGIVVETYGAQAVVRMRRAEGTQASPTAELAGSPLGGPAVSGYNGSAYAPASAIRTTAEENFTTSANGSQLDFYVTDLGTTSLLDAVTITPNGTLIANTTNGFISYGQVTIEPGYGLTLNGATAISPLGVFSGAGGVNTVGPIQSTASGIEFQANGGTATISSAGVFAGQSLSVTTTVAAGGAIQSTATGTNVAFQANGGTFQVLGNGSIGMVGPVNSTNGIWFGAESGCSSLTTPGSTSGAIGYTSSGNYCVWNGSAWNTSTLLGGTSNWTLSGSLLYPNSTSYNVAIGETSSTGAKLDVNGSINSYGVQQVYMAQSTAPAFQLTNGSVAAFVVNGYGLVAASTSYGGGFEDTGLTSQSYLATNSSGKIVGASTPVTYLSQGSGIGLSANTGSITVTNNGVTYLSAGTGVGLSANTGSIAISIGQNVSTSASPTFNVGVFNGNLTSYGIITSNCSTCGFNVLGTTAYNTYQTSGGILLNASNTASSSNYALTVYNLGVITNQGGIVAPGGFSMPSSGSATMYIGSGNFYNRTWSGYDASCGGVTDGWMGIRTDTGQIELCAGGTLYKK
jgi:hypothetical protein